MPAEPKRTTGLPACAEVSVRGVIRRAHPEIVDQGEGGRQMLKAGAAPPGVEPTQACQRAMLGVPKMGKQISVPLPNMKMPPFIEERRPSPRSLRHKAEIQQTVLEANFPEGAEEPRGGPPTRPRK